jgi:hypothetical protein
MRARPCSAGTGRWDLGAAPVIGLGPAKGRRAADAYPGKGVVNGDGLVRGSRSFIQRTCPMLERISLFAQRMATNVSRRQFLGRVGQAALALAAAVGGFLAVRGEAEAAVACGPNSSIACLGRVEGAWCPNGTSSGTCVGAPNCACVSNPRPRYCPPGTCRCRSGACRKSCC